MKMFTHAWLALKAFQQLKSFKGKMGVRRNVCLEHFIDFMSLYPSTFLRGAWFPDTVIKDNTQGGHTWKYYLDTVNGRKEYRRPPKHNTSLKFVESDLKQKVSLNARTSDLPDRCEALSQTIRDTIRITNSVKSGDVVSFNNSQIALLFLMLAHYIGDAHVPVHCDNRDFYDPSKVHPDLEDFWEKEILKYYRVSKKLGNFDLDEENNLQIDNSRNDYKSSILYKCDEIINKTNIEKLNNNIDDWRTFLGSKNNNIWDYIVSICHVSFHLSLKMFPLQPPLNHDYNRVRIMDVSPFKESVLKYSPYILADTINSISIIWLATWERWELLEKGIR